MSAVEGMTGGEDVASLTHDRSSVGKPTCRCCGMLFIRMNREHVMAAYLRFANPFSDISCVASSNWLRRMSGPGMKVNVSSVLAV